MSTGTSVAIFMGGLLVGLVVGYIRMAFYYDGIKVASKGAPHHVKIEGEGK